MTQPVTAAINRRTMEALGQRRMGAQVIDATIAALAGLALSVLCPPLCALVLAAFLAKDAVPYLSMGKEWLGLRVIDARTRHRCSLAGSLLRNLFLIPPLGMVEALLVAFSREGARLGDMLAGTYVVDVRSPVVQAEPERSFAGDAPSLSSDVAARRLLGIADDAGEEPIEEAFWQFAGRYSDDATRNLTDEELAERCAELADRYEARLRDDLRLPAAVPQAASREQMRAYITAHLVAVNKARDRLLG